MSFSIKNGRPSGTSQTREGVLHYTCNAPSMEILRMMGIGVLGQQFGLEPREVLLIPDDLFKEHRLHKDTIGAEQLLTRLSRR